MRSKLVEDSDSTEMEEPLAPSNNESGKVKESNEAKIKINLRHKFRPELFSEAKTTGYKVDVSLSEVPVETIYLESSVGRGGEVNFPITDQYFAMPLNRVFNEELIELSKIEMIRADLSYSCAWYSAEPAQISDEVSREER